MSRRPWGVSALCVAAALGAGCGGAGTSIPATTMTRPPSGPSLRQVVTAGRLTFELPTSWTVGSGFCRCSWGKPDSATLNNGPQEGGVMCNCPMESSNVPSGLHLYEGQGGLVSAGMPTTINGARVLVEFDTSNTVLTATFPGVDQWITISPGPRSGTAFTNLQQIALEKRILSTVKAIPNGGNLQEGQLAPFGRPAL